MTAVSVELTAVSDIPATIDFINASWVRTYTPLIGRDEAHSLATAKHTHQLFLREIDAADALSWIAKDLEGNIVGHLGGFQNGEGTIYIDRFHVAPDWHGKGIARLLDKAATEDARTKNYQRLELTVLEGNDRALAFYLKSGFELDETRSPVTGLGPRNALTLVKMTDRSAAD